jgi:Raf kinase inhibitor-like YbhB/YbcL family protein
VRGASTKVGKALHGVRAGDEKLAAQKLGLENRPVLEISSTDFAPAARLPEDASIEGVGIPPRIAWGEPPRGTRSLALIVEDPDAPLRDPFVHWLVYDIGPDVRSIERHGVRNAHEGKNSMLKKGYAPAAPPPGHGTHHYHFQLFALDAPLHLAEDAGRAALLDAMRDHVVAWGDLVGTYER